MQAFLDWLNAVFGLPPTSNFASEITAGLGTGLVTGIIVGFILFLTQRSAEKRSLRRQFQLGWSAARNFVIPTLTRVLVRDISDIRRIGLGIEAVALFLKEKPLSLWFAELQTQDVEAVQLLTYTWWVYESRTDDLEVALNAAVLTVLGIGAPSDKAKALVRAAILEVDSDSIFTSDDTTPDQLAEDRRTTELILADPSMKIARDEFQLVRIEMLRAHSIAREALEQTQAPVL
jgi:hypothetical protein